MSYPTQTPNPSGEPGPGQNPGYPTPGYQAGPGYQAPGYQAPGYSAPGQPGYFAPGASPEPPKRTNGFAIAALIFGILPTVVLGIIFGIVGLVKAGTYRSGRAMSIIGIVLSLLWIAPVAVISQRASKLADPGCVAAESTARDITTKLTADSGNAGAIKTDLQAAVTQLNDATGKTKHDKARAAITTMAGDFQQLLDALNNGTQLSPDFESKITADGNAIDRECGRF